MIENGQVDKDILNENPELFQNLHSTPSLPKAIERNNSNEAFFVRPDSEESEEDNFEYENVHDITHVEDESLSIEDKEKELIKKALTKNNNKRKYAAQDLGISERTLYRKIKQYEIQ